MLLEKYPEILPQASIKEETELDENGHEFFPKKLLDHAILEFFPIAIWPNLFGNRFAEALFPLVELKDMLIFENLNDIL